MVPAKKGRTDARLGRSAFLALSIALGLGSLVWPFPISADEEAPVDFGWVEVPPFVSSNADGEPEGFSIDLIARIAEIAKFEYRLRYFDKIPDVFAAQLSGEVQIQPGVAALPVLRKTNLFSDPVGSSQVRLILRADRADSPEYVSPVGKRLGIVPPGAGSEESELLRRNTVVNLPNDSSLLVKLLAGQIDGAVVAQERLLEAAHAIGVDHRIVPVGAVLNTFDRVVAVHESRADLLPRINAAIAGLRASGALADLQARWFLAVPEGRPEVLTVGVYHFPPYQTISPNGDFSGLAVESLRDLARRAELKLTFRQITIEQWSAGPGPGRYDLLPQAGINAERRLRMDFTLPIETAPFAIFMRRGATGGVSGLADLAGRKVGVQAANLARRVAEARGDLDLVLAEDKYDLLNGLLDGRSDAILYPIETVRSMAESQGVADRIEAVEPPFLVTQRAIALRRGLGSVREQLNATIPGYLISPEFRALREKWLGEPAFWTPARLYAALGVAMTALLAVCVYLGWSWVRQRRREGDYARQQRELRQEQSHAAALADVVEELQRSNRDLDDFAYTASHDLKEPLRGIAINANLLSREALTEKGRERVARMLTLSNRLEHLISELLQFSRLGRHDAVRETIDPRQIVEEIKGELKEWLAERNGTIVVATNLPKIDMVPSGARTVFFNLAVNGLKYNQAALKRVEIGFQSLAEVDGSPLRNVFYVKDNGVGIDDKHREKIFRMFGRLHREADFGAGTGVGLSFVRRIVEGLGHHITFASSPGRGTTFYFSLPLAEAQAAA